MDTAHSVYSKSEASLINAMIKKEDLRIGNYIASSKYDYRMDVETISDEGINHGCQYDGENIDKECRYENLEGIPITLEWLDEFGLTEKYDVAARYILKDWGIYYCTYNKGIRIIDKGWITDYNYIHQLQNYFYFLTGKELTVSDMFNRQIF